MEENSTEKDWSYRVEKFMYGTAIVLGIAAVIYTLRRLSTSSAHQWDLAARLVKYKISLTVADLIIIFIYAPTQLGWIITYWWYGGAFYCSFFKFLSTFSFHLTGNMQALIAIDRLNVMTKISKVTKESYSSTLAVSFAWALAFICSIPQYFAFYQYELNGHPQCVSHWTIVRHEYEQKAELDTAWQAYQTGVFNKTEEYVWPNGSVKWEMTEPPFSMDEVVEFSLYYVKVEVVYNVIHLTTMVFLPYIIELISYLLIILLLNAATTGQFIGFRAVIKRAILKLPCVTVFVRVKESLRRRHENSRERSRLQEEKRATKERSSDRVKSGQPRVAVMKRASKSQASSPTGAPLRFGFEPPTEVRVAGYTNGQLIRSPDYQSQHELSADSEKADAVAISQRKSDSVLQYKERPKNFWRMRQKTVDPIFTTELRDEQMMLHDSQEPDAEVVPRPMQTPTTEDVKGRRLSDPVTGGEKLITRQPTAPWMKTVVKARRNTKKKVFVMITVNLICWMPYFVHALFSSLNIQTEFAMKIHFYPALVVFNAISNILL